MITRRLKCDAVKDGLFSNEKMITVQERGNGKLNFVVPAEAIQGTFVTVQVFEKSGQLWAVIPSDYAQYVPVDDGYLEPA